MLALPGFPARAKKNLLLSQEVLCWRYLVSRLGQGSSFAVRDMPVACPRQRKTPYFRRRSCVGVTYFPGQSPGKYRRRK